MDILPDWLSSPNATFVYLIFTTALSLTGIYSNAVLIRAEGDEEKLQELYRWTATYVIPLFGLASIIFAVAFVYIQQNIFSIWPVIWGFLFVLTLYVSIYVPAVLSSRFMEKTPYVDRLWTKVFPRVDPDRVVNAGRGIWTIPALAYLLLIALERISIQ